MKIPGLLDAHVHMRVPGGEHKEDFRSGTAAALAGGFTALLAMPNTLPPLTTPDIWRQTQLRARRQGLCDVYHFAGADADHPDQLLALGRLAPALKLYLDETYNQAPRYTDAMLRRITLHWPRHKVIAIHAEDESISTAIRLAAECSRPVHICHVSRKEDIERIAAAKKKGLPLTCEVTPHHLFLTQADAARLGALGNMRPRLADQRDVDTLWAHINSTIDCIATDHAPHTLQEKNDPDKSPPGVPGLESALTLMLTAVNQGRIKIERLVELMHTNPYRIYGLPAQPDTWVEIDPVARFTFPEYPLRTKCGWSPFSQMPMQGRLRKVVLRGRTVYADGKLTAS